MERVKNIVFDMGGVLLDLDRDACIRAYQEIGYAQAGNLLDPYKQSGIFLQLEEGKITPAQFHDHIRGEIGKPVTDAQIDGALDKFVTDLPEYKLNMLLDLRKRFRVCMLSNTNAVMMPSIRKNFFGKQGLKLEDYFDDIYLSYEMGLVKPYAPIFEKMLREGGFNATETLFLDDAPANISTAEKLGFHTYLVRPGEDFRPVFESLQ